MEKGLVFDMKRKILAVLLLAAGLTLAACGKKAAKDTEEKGGTVNEETKEEAQAAEESSTGKGSGYLKDLVAADYVVLGNYKGIEISMEEPEVTDEYLDSYIDYILQSNAVSKPVEDRAVEIGDIANIDYVGKLDGVAFEGGTAQGYDLVIGSGQFISGFEDGCVGMKIGETKDVEATFPDPYTNPDLAGKVAVFTVTVNSISVSEVPTLTDEFVQSLNIPECTTVAQYKTYARDMLLEQQREKNESDKASLAYEKLLSECEFKELPESLVNRIDTTLHNNLASYADANGIDLATCVTFIYGGEAENYEETLAGQINDLTQYYLIMQAVADKENITVSEEEIQNGLEEGAASYGYASAEEYKGVIDFEAYKESLLTQKIADFLAENSTIVYEK